MVTPESYGRLSDLFARASELEQGQRAEFLSRECKEDQSLRTEVERLLSMDDPSGLAAPDEQSPSLDDLPPSSAEKAPRIEGYDLNEMLGRGGMGEVWRARQQSTNRDVALKLIPSLRCGSTDSRARFQREVELAARLNHPGIARVYDSGVADGTAYFTMELIEGMPLDQFARNAQFNDMQRVKLMLQVCRAVQHAHQRGVIHRDLKPSNVVVTSDEAPMLVDFGLARSVLASADEAMFVTQGIVLGTPAYMAPEQAAGDVEHVDTRSDVYSLGVMLYWLLTSKHPHDTTGSPIAAMRRVAEEDIAPPRTGRPNLNRDLEAILIKALARDPNQRYGTAGGLANDLERFVRHEPVAARSPNPLYVIHRQLWKYRGMVASLSILLLVTLAAIATYLVITRQHAIEATELAANAELGRQAAVEAEHEAKRNAYVHSLEIARSALANFQIGRAAAVLDECPNEFRGWEWGLLRRKARPVDNSYATVGPFVDRIRRMTFSRDGKRLAIATALSTTTAAHDPLIAVCDSETGNTMVELRGHTDGIFAICFTPDGQQILSGGRDQTLRRFDTQKGDLLETVAPTRDSAGQDVGFSLFAVQFSPDGKRVAFAAYPHGLFLADVVGPFSWKSVLESARCVVPLSGEDDWIDFAPDGRTLAWSTRIWQGNRGRLSIIDTRSGDVVAQLNREGGNPNFSLSFNATGERLVSANANETISILTPDLVEIGTMSGHQGPVRHAYFLNDGEEIISFGLDGLLRIWDARRSKVKAAAFATQEAGTVLAFSPHGNRVAVATGFPPVVRFWKLVDIRADPTLLARHSPKARDVAISPNGELVATCGDDGIVNVFDWPARTLRWSAEGELPNATAVAFSADSQYLAIGWSADPAIQPEMPFGRLAVVDASTGNSVRHPIEIPGWIWKLHFDRTGQRIVVADGVSPIHLPNHSASARIIDWQSGHTLHTFAVEAPRCRAATLSPSGKVLATASERAVIVWDVTTGAKLAEDRAKGGRNFAKWIDGGRRLFTGNEDAVEVRHPRTLKLLQRYRLSTSTARRMQSHYVADIAIRPDGTTFAAASWNKNVTLWERGVLDPLMNFRAHDAGVHRAVFSPDGRFLFSAAHDGTVRCWDGKYPTSLRDQDRAGHARQGRDLTSAKQRGVPPNDGGRN